MHVASSRRTRTSGNMLDRALTEAGYDGRKINWGWSGSPYHDALNPPQSIGRATNKRLALERLHEADVPNLYVDLFGGEGFEFPVIARPDYHQAGRHLHVCHDQSQLQAVFGIRSMRERPTHIQRYLEDALEFRVHVMNGQSIKISQKFGGGNHAMGATFGYPYDFHHKVTLRNVAKDAVRALGLDFGAVDILWRDDVGAKVLEVNTAPALTDPNSDTLQRWVDAFMAGGR